ncbi:class I SAM-dependent methyltransferase [Vitiosangium sp. GDMCC 1.1324]|uniref:class I SAM-dependent methyltransferase n=1 Tax=Vitiosangium sp. (strain GDMCC 1.1324) TaxID=2138576 RepID=UPI000D3A925A|nr:methyltransferase domain-containing protein [Vitiosangium sp. GDMCC 1.1324]PTL82227.1 SAM-dependent methyltransferase [Vitiosangium sp. GDMCC 1.1324]
MTLQSPPQQTSWWAERTTIIRRYDEMESRLTAPVSERMLDLACLRPGMRVLDVASGMGEPSLRAAQRVGPSGFVLGTDLAGGMLEVAREKARALALSNIEFRVADAETLEVPAQSFDAATVRWALMYMPRPERALERLWRALRPSGRLVCACWAGPEQVEYWSLPRRTLARFCPPPPPAGPDAPGVSRFSDPERLRPLLARSGFAMEHAESMHVPVMEAADGAGVVRWIRELGGPVAKLVEGLPPEAQRAWEAEVARECEHHRTGGKVFLGGVTWLVVARR